MPSLRRRSVEFPPLHLLKPRLLRKAASATKASFSATPSSVPPASPSSLSPKTKLFWHAKATPTMVRAATPQTSTSATAFPTLWPNQRASPSYSKARTFAKPTSKLPCHSTHCKVVRLLLDSLLSVWHSAACRILHMECESLLAFLFWAAIISVRLLLLQQKLNHLESLLL